MWEGDDGDMKILLMTPPFYKFIGTHNNHTKVSLGILSAILRRKTDFEVLQYNPDYGMGPFATQIELFEMSEEFKRNITKPFHPIYKEVFDTIDKVKPDIVGLSIVSGTVIQSEIIAKYCHDNGISVMAGGPMVTLALDKFIENHDFDQLVPSEAEEGIVRAVKHPNRRVIMGMAVADLNTIPFADRGNFVDDMKEGFYGGMITSRGCKFKCKYCAHWLAGGAIRYRSAENVLKELEIIIEKYNQRFFRFFDDTFVMNRKRIVELCSLIVSRNINIEFLVETRPDTLDEGMIRLLKSAGMVQCKLGVESGSQRILDIYRGGIKKDRIREAVSLLKKHDVPVTTTWMYGFPEENDDDLKQTIEFAREINPKWNTISSVAPYYGTDLFDQLSEDIKKQWKFFYHNSRIPIMNPDLSLELIDEFLGLNDEKERVGV